MLSRVSFDSVYIAFGINKIEFEYCTESLTNCTTPVSLAYFRVMRQFPLTSILPYLTNYMSNTLPQAKVKRNCIS